jgi:hypothetical protein
MQYFSPFVQEIKKIQNSNLNIGFESQFEENKPIMNNSEEMQINLVTLNVQSEFNNLVDLSKNMQPFPAEILENHYLKEIQAKINKN